MSRAALTQTINAYPDMPDDLRKLEGKLEDVREATGREGDLLR